MIPTKGKGKKPGEFSLKCFGVGDGWPSPDRDHSAFLYQFPGQSVLIDCGEPISRSFKASGLDYNTIDRVLISHLHLDHIGGFFMLIQGYWLERRTKDLPVHMPADGIEPSRQLLEAGCIFDELLHFRLSYEALKPNKPITSGPVRITPFATNHLTNLRDIFQARHPQGFEAFSFLLETGGLRVAHSADIGRAEDLAPLLAGRLDLLVCELAHVAAEEVFRYLQGREVKRIIFIHLAREYRKNFAQIKALAAKHLKGKHVSWARCGQLFTFPEK